jgi:hypothetical protein
VSKEELHLIRNLQTLLSNREHPSRPRNLRAHEGYSLQENRRLVRDCIKKIRQLRAGVAMPWLGLGQREERRPG